MWVWGHISLKNTAIPTTRRTLNIPSFLIQSLVFQFELYIMQFSFEYFQMKHFLRQLKKLKTECFTQCSQCLQNSPVCIVPYFPQFLVPRLWPLFYSICDIMCDMWSRKYFSFRNTSGFPCFEMFCYMLRSSFSSLFKLLIARNIYITNGNGYVPFLVISSPSFPHSWLVTTCLPNVAQRVNLVEQELNILQEYNSSCCS